MAAGARASRRRARSSATAAARTTTAAATSSCAATARRPRTAAAAATTSAASRTAGGHGPTARGVHAHDVPWRSASTAARRATVAAACSSAARAPAKDICGGQSPGVCGTGLDVHEPLQAAGHVRRRHADDGHGHASWQAPFPRTARPTPCRTSWSTCRTPRSRRSPPGVSCRCPRHGQPARVDHDGGGRNLHAAERARRQRASRSSSSSVVARARSTLRHHDALSPRRRRPWATSACPARTPTVSAGRRTSRSPRCRPAASTRWSACSSRWASTLSEFTNAGGAGRIQTLLRQRRQRWVRPAESTLTSSLATMEQYDQVLFPCWGEPAAKPAADLANIVSYTSAGGRVFATHYSYTWLYQNAPFSTTATWDPRHPVRVNDVGLINTGFAAGQDVRRVDVARGRRNGRPSDLPDHQPAAGLRQPRRAVAHLRERDAERDLPAALHVRHPVDVERDVRTRRLQRLPRLGRQRRWPELPQRVPGRPAQPAGEGARVHDLGPGAVPGAEHALVYAPRRAADYPWARAACRATAAAT